MNDAEFAARVARLETVAIQHPEAYRRRVLGLALLGNAYLGTVLLMLAVLVFGLALAVTVLKALAIKLLLIVGVFLWSVLKALHVRFEPPQGNVLQRTEAPELFTMIDGLRRDLGAPRFHRVLLTDEFNAGVVQTPRLGIFGWPQNDLLIGLPLMKALTVEQFRAVLAHEFGHLAGGHALLSNWIYRQRLRWGRLLDTLEEHGGGGFLFRPFLKWYAPYFNAYSFPLARANEYEADAASSRLTSPQAAAQALTAVNVVGAWLHERYWPGITRQADDVPQPGFAPYSGMHVGEAGTLDTDAAQGWLTRALERRTNLADTHPALTDRLAYLGEAPNLVLPAPADSADRLLGPARDALATRMDREWQAAIGPAWAAHHQEVQHDRSRLAELDACSGELGANEAYERALLTESRGYDADAALEQLRTLYAGHPELAGVAFSFGARLLARDDAAGCEPVERAMALDPRNASQGAELLRDFHWRNGREDEARTWEKRRIERLTIESQAEQERNRVTLKDRFQPHGLDDATSAGLVAALKAVPGLHRAYLVRKAVEHFPDEPCYVCGFGVTAWYGWHRKRKADEVQRLLLDSLRFPGETIVINVEGDNRRFDRKLRKQRGSRIV